MSAAPIAGDVGAQATLTGDLGVSKGLTARAVLGAQHIAGGATGLRDGGLGLAWRARDTGDLTAELRAGLTIPVGEGSELGLSATSTGSVDPTLGGSLQVGAIWVAGLSVTTQVPLYPGSDGVKQGPFGAAALRLGRRLEWGVPWAAIGGAAQVGAFSEVTGELGVALLLGERTGVGVEARVPLWAQDAEWPAAGGVSIRRVFGDR